ncbi:MAG: hypothetical protein LQ344_007695 [Seirophora lacunosa]|nr:MAG: hypothetical protein LQ344_007695 [Seirophora lacunosa]
MPLLTHILTIFLLLAGSQSAPAARSPAFSDTYQQRRMSSVTEAIQASTTNPSGYKPQAPLVTLQISQYARKTPENPGPAGNYYIMASVINITVQYPNGTLLGSTREPTATDDDRVSFQITTEKDVHDITIKTTVRRWKMVDPDSADLVILGFPVRDRQLWSSDSQCEVGQWHPADDAYLLESLPFLGNFTRNIRCYD